VAFRSSATNLVVDDSNANDDILVHDLVTGTTERVSVSSTGGEANDDSGAPSLSDDGRFVAFVTRAGNLVGTGNPDAWVSIVRDRVGQTTTLGMFNHGFIVRVHLSGDGRYLTGHWTNGASFIRDRFSGAVHAISPVDGPDVFYPVLSANGRYVAVISAAALVPLPPGPPRSQVLVLPNPL
jgi:Tol biopolymer transport system component